MSATAFEPVDWAVLGASGGTVLFALAACLHSVPWRRSGGKDATRSFSVLWRGRAVLALICAAAAASQLLRLGVLWGANSVVFPSGITSWTGAGWMCRMYLTLSLGLLQPLCAFTALLMLKAALSRKHRPEAARHPNARLLGLALLCTLPVAAAQAVVAWLGLVLQVGGQPIEAAPRSVLGIFFAAYWQGTQQQCGTAGGGSAAAAVGLPTIVACTACVFPAAAVIAHGVFVLCFLLALAVTSTRLAAAVLNTRLKRRVRIFQAVVSLLAVAGVAALGVSISRGPFSWLNVGCWIAYIVSTLLLLAVVVWEVVVCPVRDLRAIDKRLVLWADGSAALAAAADEGPGSGRGSGSGALIRAHNRSSEAEAYVVAAAAARTQAVVLAAAPPLAHQSAQPLPSPRPADDALPLRPAFSQRHSSLLGQQLPSAPVVSSPHLACPPQAAWALEQPGPPPLFTSAMHATPAHVQPQYLSLYP